MAGESTAPHLVVSAAHANGGTLTGVVGGVIEKIVDREVIQADDQIYPAARPPVSIDARVTIDCLKLDAVAAESTTAGNVTVSFKRANGTTGASVVIGPMVYGSGTHAMQRNTGGMATQVTFEMEGSTLTYTATP